MSIKRVYDVSPQPVVGIADAVGIAAGRYHSCALLRDGKVKCWGSNLVGELGAIGIDGSSSPVDVPALAGATQLVVGQRSSCAVMPDGNGRCVRGSRRVGDAAHTADVILGHPIVSWVIGFSDEYAVLADGSVNCRGVTCSRVVDCRHDESMRTWAKLPDSANATMVDTADDWAAPACAVLKDGGVVCWGSLRPALVEAGACDVAPYRMQALAGVVDLSIEGTDACARTAKGEVLCWGKNLYGGVGDGTLSERPIPVALPTLPPASQLDMHASACAVAQGHVWCWSPDFSRRGRNLGPRMLRAIDDVMALSRGSDHRCALRKDGSVWCWGEDTYGQLGRGAARTPEPGMFIAGSSP